MQLHPISTARALGLDPETWPGPMLRAISEGEGGFALTGTDEAHAIECAALRRAIERYPLQMLTGGPAAGEPAEPHDGGTDDCPPAAVRHVCAGALVGSLVTSSGFPYGEPPLLPVGAGPIRPIDPGDWPLPADGSDPDRAPRGRYQIAEDVCEYLCRMSTVGDPDGPSNDRIPGELDPEEWSLRVIDAAIDLLCDGEHHVAEVAAGIAAWVVSLGMSRGAPRDARDDCAARARRICSAVGVRFPRGDR